MSSFKWPPSGGSSSGGVSSLNTLTGAVILAAGTNVTITPSGNTLTIASSGGASGLTSINTDSTAAQVLSVGTAGSDFAITNPGGGSHVFNLPTASASNRGALSSADWSTFNGKQSALTIGDLTVTANHNISVTGGTGSVIGSGVNLDVVGASLVEAVSSVLAFTGATNAVLGSGVSIQVKQSSTSQSGYLSNTDWNTFNGKQAAGNYITALTGDATASGPGSVALTLATVASAGTTGSSTSIPSVTINAKGLVTSVTGNAVIAPAGTLTGTTLASNVVTSSLTSVGTITTGVWNGTTLDVGHGGTGITSTPTNGQIPIGNGTNYTAAAITAGTGVVVTNGSGSISIAASTFSQPYIVNNQGFQVSASAGALTIALKQADGSTNPSTGGSSVVIGMRSGTATTGGYNTRSVTGALSQSLTSGTTLGMLAAQVNHLWLYAIDSDGAGTMKLGASSVRLDDESLQSSVAESFSATATNASPAVFTASNHGMPNGTAVQITGTPPTGFSTGTTYYVVSTATNTFDLASIPGGTAINSSSTGSSIVIHIADGSLVSDAAYTSVPIRLLGRAKFNLVTSGTWITPTEVSVSSLILGRRETIAAGYFASVNAASDTTQSANFDSRQYDTHGCVFASAPGTGNWRFRAIISGIYKVYGWAQRSAGGGNISIYKNGSNAGSYATIDPSTSYSPYAMSISLVTGDYIDLRIPSSTMTGGAITSTNASTIYIECTN